MPSLTPKIRARRIAVAEDVLKQLRARKLKPTPDGYYLEPRDRGEFALALGTFFEEDNSETDLRNVVDVVTTHCDVCARGALLLSKARLFDAVPLDAVLYPCGDSRCSQQTTTDYLEDTFDQKTLDLIEIVFERTMGLSQSELTHREKQTAVDFGNAASSRETDRGSRMRLIAIVNNLIANRGRLVLTQAPDTRLYRPRPKADACAPA